MADILNEFIGYVLKEAALGPDDMPDGSYVVISDMGGEFVVVALVNSDTGDHIAEVGIHRPEEYEGPSSGAWIVSTTSAKKGWGPMLYDIAIEWATLNGPGLAPDRESVSPDAYRVWDYYLHKRPDVKSHQLDTLYNTLTQAKDDNSEQMATSKYLKVPKDKLDPDGLRSSPLSKYYTKPPTTINLLRQMGRIKTK